MLRVTFHRPASRVRIRYADSVNAAIIWGLRSGGASSEVVGSAPWTFATAGRSFPGGDMVVNALTVSTADPEIAEALRKTAPDAIKVKSSNGDEIDFAGANVVVEVDPVVDGMSEIAFAFPKSSPFVVPKPKTGRDKTEFFESLEGLDLSAAFSANLSRRAGREIAVGVAVDMLTAAVDGRRQIIRLRKASRRDIFIPGFSLALTMRGKAEDLRFAYHAGVGAKTRAGFGCPMVAR